MRRIVRKALLGTGGALLALVLSHWLLLAYPTPLFAYQLREGAVVLHSDRPFDPAAARRVLRRASARLRTSPLLRPGDRFHVYLCNTAWRRLLLMYPMHERGGGVNHYPASPHAFLRTGDLVHDRLVAPDGTPKEAARPLSYYMAHEITHALTGRELGPLAYLRLPVWVREGYADYVGRGDRFDFDDALRAVQAGERRADPHRSGLYLRYHLQVAWLLERRRWPVRGLLHHPPDDAAVERALAAVNGR